MLAAFKEDLKRLAADPRDDFHGKVRRRIGKRATAILEKRLKQIILLMPSLVKRIRDHWQDENANTDIKKMGSFVFAYLYHPHDFLSKDEHGLFGYLDDAYLVVNIYERVISGAKTLSDEDLEFLMILQKTKKYVQAVIPKETKRIEEMIEGALNEEKFEKFAAAFQGAA